MPKLSTTKKDFDGGDGIARWLPPGRFTCVVTAFSELIETEWQGKISWRYVVSLEEVCSGDQQGRSTSLKIIADHNGEPLPNNKGWGRYDKLLDACHVDRTIEEFDTDQLIYRALSVELMQPDGFAHPFVSDTSECTPEDEEAALEYVGRWYPMK